MLLRRAGVGPARYARTTIARGPSAAWIWLEQRARVRQAKYFRIIICKRSGDFEIEVIYHAGAGKEAGAEGFPRGIDGLPQRLVQVAAETSALHFFGEVQPHFGGLHTGKALCAKVNLLLIERQFRPTGCGLGGGLQRGRGERDLDQFRYRG